MPRPEKFRIGEILVQQKILSQEQLKLALEEQKRSGRKLGRVFVENGFVTEEEISQALAKQLRIPYMNLKYYNVSPETARKIPETQARRFRALALEDRGTRILVGMSDPTDLFAYDEIAKILKTDIEIAVVNEGVLMQTIDRVYRRTQEITGLAQELGQEIGESYVDFGALASSQNLEEAPVVKLLQTMFEDATQVGASDIHIEPQESQLMIRFRIDGVLHMQMQADSKIASAVVLRLKLMSGLDISEKRLPQDGRFNVKIRQAQVDVRISSMPTQYGESVVMRLLNQSGGMLGLEHLGMPAEMLTKFRNIIRRPTGMVLVTGPTGSGKTTTLYAALSELNSIQSKIITVEDPVEYRLPGINQVQVHEKIDLSFSRVLRSALRQDPDIILIGEMRDEDTVQIGLRAALTGHLVLSTLHTNDSVSTPLRLMDMGAPRYMVAMSLQAVLAQRLVRKLCESCIEDYALRAHEREWLRLEMGDKVDEVKYSYGRGCTHCNGTGYQGRIGVYELLEMTAPLIIAANQENPTHFIRLARGQLAGETIRRQAVRLVTRGATTVAEAMRISNQFED